MSGHRPTTRSRARDGGFGYQTSHETDFKNIPPPLNIRKDAVRQHVDTTSIGLAMGSPRDSPLPPTPHAPPDYSDTFTLPPSANGQFMASENMHKQLPRDSKPKGTRWKTFGSFFGRKDGTIRPEASLQHQMDPSTPSKPSQLSAAQNSVTRKRAGSDKEKAMESQKSMPGGKVARGPSLLRRTSTRRKVGARRKPGHSRQETSRTRAAGVGTLNRTSPSTIIGVDHQNHHRPQAQAFSLLQVEIPNIELERYSVMFGNVLVPGLKSGSKTSLLQTPPGILEEAETAFDLSVAPANPEVLERPHTRVGSGSSSRSKSPSFSLFPSTSSSPTRRGVNKALPKPSPLGRSVTAPGTNDLPISRPILKPNKTEDIVTHAILSAVGKENVPLSKWNSTHTRDSSGTSTHTRTRSFDQYPRSPTRHSHVANLSFDNSIRSTNSHSRHHSFEPSLRSPASDGTFYDVSEFPPISPLTLVPPAVPAKSPRLGSTGRSSDHSNNNNNSNSSKQTFIDRAFPARKSSLKRPKHDGDHRADKPLPEYDFQLPIPQPPKPPYVESGRSFPLGQHQSNDSVASAAEISIARQISMSRKQRQLLVPVVSKTAVQPLQPQVVDGMGRKSELVLFEDA